MSPSSLRAPLHPDLYNSIGGCAPKRFSAAKLGLSCAALLLLAGCSEDSPPDAVALKRLTSPLTVPTPALDRFVVLSRAGAVFGQRCSVTGGSIGVLAGGGGVPPNTLSAGIDSRLGLTAVLLAPRVVLGERVLAGEIGASEVVAPPSAVTGPRSGFVAPPSGPSLGAVSPGTADVTVNVGQTTTLRAGRFGNVTVSGDLVLSGGSFELRSLRLNPDARLLAQADSSLRVQQSLAIADRGQVNVGAGLTPSNLRVLVAGADPSDNSVTLGVEARLNGLVVAQRTLRAADRVILNGAVSARQVVFGNDARVSFGGGFECASASSCDDGNPCTVDACLDTRCTHSTAPNGSPCDDGDACTQTDGCQAGVCRGDSPVVCQALDSCHAPGACDPSTGLCSRPALPDGTTCDDGLSCTHTDTCQAGDCGGTAVVCSALDQCHAAGACDETSGLCSNPPKADGSACSDGDACTTVDTCQAGVCAGSSSVVCVALDQCHAAGHCDPSSGACSNPTLADGTACSDGNACTQTDVCQAGSCQGGPPTVCAALDACHVPGACEPATGICSQPAAPDGTACDDADPCSLGDFCSAGSCRAGEDFSVTEFASGLLRPRSIVAGPQDSLWFVAPETTPGARDGSMARITTAGVVTSQAVSRDLGALLHGPDDKLWVSTRLIGGLPVLGRFDAVLQAFASDFIGINAFDLAASNDNDTPIIWFTGGSAIGRITPSGQLLASVPTFNVTRAITAAQPAPTTLIWFTEANGGGFALIGRLDFPRLQQFPVATPGELVDIVEGPDAGIWFTDPARNQVGRMAAVGGGLTEHPLPSPLSDPRSIVAGPDGNLWLTLRGVNKIARMTPAGAVTELCIPTPDSEPTHLTFGSDGNLWFTEAASGKVGRVELSP